eukprot:TRINITY_DN4294_c0_g1_i5.p1 TRINITY_DN4294_c0_g1~~TRINITY_DN4294_c0_g1_i5.p1  ORF type:complete len:568 (-),score=62.13 TRINITY_DN4294_c0_g1_i5:89-1792(-)
MKKKRLLIQRNCNPNHLKSIQIENRKIQLKQTSDLLRVRRFLLLKGPQISPQIYKVTHIFLCLIRLITTSLTMGFLPRKPSKAYICLVGAGFLSLVCGTSYLIGSISVYLISFFINFHPDMDLNVFSGLLVYAAIISQFAGTQTLPLADKVGNKLLSFIVLTMMCGHHVLSSFHTSITLFCATFAGLFAPGYSMIWYLYAPAAWSWFPEAKGKITGILYAFVGFASLPFNSLAERSVNPEGLKPEIIIPNGMTEMRIFESAVTDRVPIMLQNIAIAMAVFGIIGLVLVNSPPKNLERRKSHAAHQSLSLDPTKLQKKAPSIMASKFWTNLSFWQLFLIQYAAVMPAVYIAFNIVGSVAMVCNGVFRPVWGWLFDVFGFKKVILVNVSLLATLLVGLPFVDDENLFLVCTCVILVCEGGLYVLCGSQCLKAFGVNYGARLMPFLNLANLVVNASMYFVNVLVLPNLGLVPTFLFFMSAFQLLALFVILRYDHEKEIDFDPPALATISEPIMIETKRVQGDQFTYNHQISCFPLFMQQQIVTVNCIHLLVIHDYMKVWRWNVGSDLVYI